MKGVAILVKIVVGVNVNRRILSMTGKEYQKLAMRTNDGKAEHRLAKTEDIGSSINSVGGLLNGVLGLTGEAGEVADLVKKGIFHEKGIDLEHLQKELGDVMWYIAMICDSCGLDMECVMETNIEKLKARYPEGFDTFRANHREVGDV